MILIKKQKVIMKKTITDFCNEIFFNNSMKLFNNIFDIYIEDNIKTIIEYNLRDFYVKKDIFFDIDYILDLFYNFTFSFGYIYYFKFY